MTDPATPVHAQPPAWLSRIEDAGINASAPTEQRWVDGWLVRFNPGKAKRARCVQAVAAGHLTLDERLAICQRLFDTAGLPMVLRITPFSQPEGLDEALAQRGYALFEPTQVMLARPCPHTPAAPWPDGVVLQQLSHAEFAQAVGELRGSPPSQRQAQAQRLAASPVPYQGWVLRRLTDHAVLACGQIAIEDDMVGLYDVFTHPEARGQGLGTQLCQHLLSTAHAAGAQVAYLQVSADNHAARAIYHRLGFTDAYSYHYRSLDPAAA